MTDEPPPKYRPPTIGGEDGPSTVGPRGGVSWGFASPLHEPFGGQWGIPVERKKLRAGG